MFVTKRDGSEEPMSFDKITSRLKKLMWGLDHKYINLFDISKKIIQGMYNKIETVKLDELSSQMCANLITDHLDYGILASRIEISNLHKQTEKKFSLVIEELYNYINPNTNERGSLISKQLYRIVSSNKKKINSSIIYDRDFNYDYFGIKTLQKSYLLKINKKIIERPQHMLMRVAIGIHGKDLDKAIETYNYMSLNFFTHATPTLFNAGTPKPQLSSCFLLQMEDDSIDGIYETLKHTAKISKNAGGIGLAIHNVRSNGSYIKGTNGHSNGIIPMLRVFNNTARYVDQCITPDTIIYTKDGIKEIKKIKINDMIITKDGTFQKVTKIMHYNKNEKLYNLSLCNSIYDIKVTEFHPFLCIANQNKGLNYNVIKNRLNKNLIKPEWIEMKDLNTKDFIGFPIPKYEEDIPEYSLDDCFIYGILIGDGYICKNSKLIGVCLNNTTKIPLVNFVKQYLSNKLIHYTESFNDKIIKLVWTSTNEFPYTRDMLYDDQDEKIIMGNMLHLPKDKIINIIKGVLLTDGSYLKEISLELTSKQVIESVRYMLLRCGILTSGYVRDRIGQTHEIRKNEHITTRKKTYVLRIPKKKIICDIYNIEEGDFFKFFEHNQVLYSRIKNISSFNYDGLVYDLEIENNHNYLTHSGLIHNGGGKRKGSFAMYLEPWHGDIFSFLDLRKNHGNEEDRCRDLFLGLWIPDLFMQRVFDDGDWCLMCPNQCKGLHLVYGDEFNALYTSYEEKGKYLEKIKARKLWNAILDSQIETGTPYMLYKDACNKKSNQQNLGTIQSSNLCTEIIEFTSKDESAVCNLASIGLPKFVKDDNTFDFVLLGDITRLITRNLDQIIDINYYPIPQNKNSNIKHRPIGIGVQGLADVFLMLKMPFESDEAKLLNKQIFATIYYNALVESNKLAIEKGSYSSFENSPASKGLLQFDLWNKEPLDMYDWNDIKEKIKKNGLRNSLLLAPMPTASTSQILGNNECFEPYTTNVYIRRTLAGEFICINKHLLKDCMELGIWNNNLKNQIIQNNGSLNGIDSIPDNLKNLYKTVWEIKQKNIIDMSADRGIYIDQSQSLNIHMNNVNHSKLTSMHFYGWKKGLKTGMYYLRTQSAADSIKFSINKEELDKNQNDEDIQKQNIEKAKLFCSIKNKDECTMCSA